MTIPYSSGQSSASGNASTVNDLGGMNLSTLEDNDLLKRVDANNLGGSGIEAQVSIPVAPASTHVHAMFTKAGVESMASLISQTNTTTNEYKFDVKANAGNTSTSGLTIKDDGSAETRVGINVNDPAETLDITGNLQVRDGDIQYKLTNGTQVVELDGGLNGTDGGKFIVKTKVNNGNMTQKFEINNAGTATLNGAHVAQGYFFAKYGVPRNVERLKTTKEEILSSDSVSQSLADPNKSEPISCQGLLDCAASAVIASTNASGLHTLPPSGSSINTHLTTLLYASKVKFGQGAASTSQGADAVAIGLNAGQNQNDLAIAIGKDAGKLNQQWACIAIGDQAGETQQGGINSFSIAIGAAAGQTHQDFNAIAMGQFAGGNNQ